MSLYYVVTQPTVESPYLLTPYMCLWTEVHEAPILWKIIWKILRELGFHGPHMHLQYFSVCLLKKVQNSVGINHLSVKYSKALLLEVHTVSIFSLNVIDDVIVWLNYQYFPIFLLTKRQ